MLKFFRGPKQKAIEIAALPHASDKEVLQWLAADCPVQPEQATQENSTGQFSTQRCLTAIARQLVR